jgi:hypothetical protein
VLSEIEPPETAIAAPVSTMPPPLLVLAVLLSIASLVRVTVPAGKLVKRPPASSSARLWEIEPFEALRGP